METTFCELNEPADDEISQRAELAAPRWVEGRVPLAVPFSFPDRCAFLMRRVNELRLDAALN